MLTLSPQVVATITRYAITREELQRMVERAALTSKQGFNRRFHHWFFTMPNDTTVVKMELGSP